MLLLGSGLIGLDQVSKFALTIYINRGGAFSVPLRNEFVLILGLLVAIIVAVVWHRWIRTTSYLLFATLIIAGGASNLLDRLVFGGVRDIWQVGTLYFNLADIYVVAGLLGLVISYIYDRRD